MKLILSKLAKALAFSLSLALFIQGSVLAYSIETNFWNERRKNTSDLEKSTQLASLPQPLPPAPAIIPPPQHLVASSHKMNQKNNKVLNSLLPQWALQSMVPYATIQEVRPSQKINAQSKTIYLIQDIHLQQEAQKNIASLLGAIAEKHPNSNTPVVVGMEGTGLKKIDTSFYDAISDRPELKIVSEALLEKNILNGIESAVLSTAEQISRPAFQVVGLENQQLFDAHVRAIKEAYPQKERLIAAWAKDRQEMSRRIEMIEDDPLRQWLETYLSYQEGNVDLPDYVLFLNSLTDISSPELKKMVAAVLIEGSLSFPKVESERSRLLATLVEKLTQKEINALLSTSSAFQAGQLSAGTYFNELKQICLSKGILLQNYPEMNLYIQYVIKTESIHVSNLMDELDVLHASLLQEIAASNPNGKLFAEVELLSLTKKILNFSLTESEWKRYQLLTNSPNKNNPFAAFEDFYKLALARNEAMAERMAENLNRSALNYGMMVVGGFHSNGILQLLNQQGFNAVLLSPKLSQGVEGVSSIEVLATGRLPLDQLFVGEKLFIPVQPMTADPVRGPRLEQLVDGSVNFLKTGEAQTVGRYELKEVEAGSKTDNATLNLKGKIIDLNLVLLVGAPATLFLSSAHFSPWYLWGVFVLIIITLAFEKLWKSYRKNNNAAFGDEDFSNVDFNAATKGVIEDARDIPGITEAAKTQVGNFIEDFLTQEIDQAGGRTFAYFLGEKLKNTGTDKFRPVWSLLRKMELKYIPVKDGMFRSGNKFSFGHYGFGGEARNHEERFSYMPINVDGELALTPNQYTVVAGHEFIHLLAKDLGFTAEDAHEMATRFHELLDAELHGDPNHTSSIFQKKKTKLLQIADSLSEPKPQSTVQLREGEFNGNSIEFPVLENVFQQKLDLEFSNFLSLDDQLSLQQSLEDQIGNGSRGLEDAISQLLKRIEIRFVPAKQAIFQEGNQLALAQYKIETPAGAPTKVIIYLPLEQESMLAYGDYEYMSSVGRIAFFALLRAHRIPYGEAEKAAAEFQAWFEVKHFEREDHSTRLIRKKSKDLNKDESSNNNAAFGDRDFTNADFEYFVLRRKSEEKFEINEDPLIENAIKQGLKPSLLKILDKNAFLHPSMFPINGEILAALEKKNQTVEESISELLNLLKIRFVKTDWGVFEANGKFAAEHYGFGGKEFDHGERLLYLSTTWQGNPPFKYLNYWNVVSAHGLTHLWVKHLGLNDAAAHDLATAVHQAMATSMNFERNAVEKEFEELKELAQQALKYSIPPPSNSSTAKIKGRWTTLLIGSLFVLSALNGWTMPFPDFGIEVIENPSSGISPWWWVFGGVVLTSLVLLLWGPMEKYLQKRRFINRIRQIMDPASSKKVVMITNGKISQIKETIPSFISYGKKEILVLRGFPSAEFDLAMENKVSPKRFGITYAPFQQIAHRLKINVPHHGVIESTLSDLNEEQLQMLRQEILTLNNKDKFFPRSEWEGSNLDISLGLRKFGNTSRSWSAERKIPVVSSPIDVLVQFGTDDKKVLPLGENLVLTEENAKILNVGPKTRNLWISILSDADHIIEVNPIQYPEFTRLYRDKTLSVKDEEEVSWLNEALGNPPLRKSKFVSKLAVAFLGFFIFGERSLFAGSFEEISAAQVPEVLMVLALIATIWVIWKGSIRIFKALTKPESEKTELSKSSNSLSLFFIGFAFFLGITLAVLDLVWLGTIPGLISLALSLIFIRLGSEWVGDPSLTETKTSLKNFKYLVSDVATIVGIQVAQFLLTWKRLIFAVGVLLVMVGFPSAQRIPVSPNPSENSSNPKTVYVEEVSDIDSSTSINIPETDTIVQENNGVEPVVSASNEAQANESNSVATESSNERMPTDVAVHPELNSNQPIATYQFELTKLQKLGLVLILISLLVHLFEKTVLRWLSKQKRINFQHWYLFDPVFLFHILKPKPWNVVYTSKSTIEISDGDIVQILPSDNTAEDDVNLPQITEGNSASFPSKDEIIFKEGISADKKWGKGLLTPKAITPEYVAEDVIVEKINLNKGKFKFFMNPNDHVIVFQNKDKIDSHGGIDFSPIKKWAGMDRYEFNKDQDVFRRMMMEYLSKLFSLDSPSYEFRPKDLTIDLSAFPELKVPLYKRIWNWIVSKIKAIKNSLFRFIPTSNKGMGKKNKYKGKSSLWMMMSGAGFLALVSEGFSQGMEAVKNSPKESFLSWQSVSVALAIILVVSLVLFLKAHYQMKSRIQSLEEDLNSQALSLDENKFINQFRDRFTERFSQLAPDKTVDVAVYESPQEIPISIKSTRQGVLITLDPNAIGSQINTIIFRVRETNRVQLTRLEAIDILLTQAALSGILASNDQITDKDLFERNLLPPNLEKGLGFFPGTISSSQAELYIEGRKLKMSASVGGDPRDISNKLFEVDYKYGKHLLAADIIPIGRLLRAKFPEKVIVSYRGVPIEITENDLLKQSLVDGYFGKIRNDDKLSKQFVDLHDTVRRIPSENWASYHGSNKSPNETFDFSSHYFPVFNQYSMDGDFGLMVEQFEQHPQRLKQKSGNSEDPVYQGVMMNEKEFMGLLAEADLAGDKNAKKINNYLNEEFLILVFTQRKLPELLDALKTGKAGVDVSPLIDDLLDQIPGFQLNRVRDVVLLSQIELEKNLLSRHLNVLIKQVKVFPISVQLETTIDTYLYALINA